MSEISSIGGDMAVGRNLDCGGHLNAEGNARIGGDLRVDGWLDVRHLKWANKGVFGTLASLQEAYPDPRPGWFAGVGVTSPVQLYVVMKNSYKRYEWKAATDSSNNPVVLEFTLDNQRMADVEALLNGISAWRTAMSGKYFVDNLWEVDPEAGVIKFGWKYRNSITGDESEYKYITFGGATTEAAGVMTAGQCTLLEALNTWKTALTDKYHVANIWDAGTTESTYKFGFSGANNITGAVEDYQYITIPAATNSKAGVMTAGQCTTLTDLQTLGEDIKKLNHYFKVESYTNLVSAGLKFSRYNIGTGSALSPTVETVGIPVVSETSAGILDKNQYCLILDNIQDNEDKIKSKVVEFCGMVSGVTASGECLDSEVDNIGTVLVYDSENDRFLVVVTTVEFGVITRTYYSDWKNRTRHCPLGAKTIYVDRNTDKVYRYNGTTLVELCVPEAKVVPFGGIKAGGADVDSETVISVDLDLDEPSKKQGVNRYEVFWDEDGGQFVVGGRAMSGSTSWSYFSNCASLAKWPKSKSAIYINLADNTTYRYNGTTLVRLNANE